MNESTQEVHQHLDELYREADYWHVNTGGNVIHAKRMPGFYRAVKWLSMSVWLVFFLGPYFRWDGRQAVLWDIPGRQFHVFEITILPQDVWILALVLLFFALLLAAVTSIAGRVFCGYFCFQTVWTDIFTWIEEKLEGQPSKRVKLDNAPWNLAKVRIKLVKHLVWLLIGMLTGISFTAWFTDAYQLWGDYLTLQAPMVAWLAVGIFTFFTYLFAAHMREQVCFWLCPYARIQGVMYDRETILPTYDFARGEPRGKLKKAAKPSASNNENRSAVNTGDCIDCKQCVAVCPTGIDIRRGQQEGCITCALCIDACDAVMDKIKRPRGLIRYASLDEIEARPAIRLIKRPRVLLYIALILLAVTGIIYGLTNLAGIELKVLHERQPLYVLRSDGAIQNKYELKVLNKTKQAMSIQISVTGHPALQFIDADQTLVAPAGRIVAHTVFLRIPGESLTKESIPVRFSIIDKENPTFSAVYESMFFGPAP